VARIVVKCFFTCQGSIFPWSLILIFTGYLYGIIAKLDLFLTNVKRDGREENALLEIVLQE
jgi:hypothetical protein